jgi:hypothetical protein
VLRVLVPGERDENFSANVPRSMDGRGLKIVKAYTDAGHRGEANCVIITDGKRTAIYVPLRIVELPEEEGDQQGMGRTGRFPLIYRLRGKLNSNDPLNLKP